MTGYTEPTERELIEILATSRTVAIVGMSADSTRPSHIVASYLVSPACAFEEVWFVNPRGGVVLGRPVYRSLGELPGVPDLVDVFRRADALEALAEEVVSISGTRTFWAQLGLRSDRVAEVCAAAGRNVVMDRCLKIEHARHASGIGIGSVTRGLRSR